MAVLAPETRLLVTAEGHARVDEVVATSALPASAIDETLFPVAGSMTSSFRPDAASIHSPPMKSCGLRFRNAATAGDGLGWGAIGTAFTADPPESGGSPDIWRPPCTHGSTLDEPRLNR